MNSTTANQYLATTSTNFGAIVTATVTATVCVIFSGHLASAQTATLEGRSNESTAYFIGQLPSSTFNLVDPDARRWAAFQNLVNVWKKERSAISSITEAAMIPSYLKIVGMGQDAVPLIMRQLKSEGDDPDQWFLALRLITGQNPVNADHQGDFLKMSKAWLEWYEEEYAG
jgi:hypothetical protein